MSSAEQPKESIDRAIREYLAPDLNAEVSEMVSTWVIVAVTSTVDGGAATHVVADRVLPLWQVKGALTHGLDVVTEGGFCD